MRVVLAVLAAAVGLAGLLYVALPANENAPDGPADPILGPRRAVIRALQWLDLAPRRTGLLPGGYSSEWYEPGKPSGARLTRRFEPVYRGLFWPVGARVTVRMEEFGDLLEDVRGMRLGYRADGREIIAAEVAFDAGAADRQVTSFVPAGSACWFVDELHATGRWEELCSHGAMTRTESFRHAR